jgi:hypothetical protein
VRLKRNPPRSVGLAISPKLGWLGWLARWSGPLLESPMQWREWVTVSMYSQAFGVPVKKSLMTHPLIPIGVVIAGMMSGIAAADVAPQGVSNEASIFRGRSAAMWGDHRLLSRCRNRL